MIGKIGGDAQNQQHAEEPTDPVGDVGKIDRLGHRDVPRPGTDRKPVNPDRLDRTRDDRGLRGLSAGRTIRLGRSRSRFGTLFGLGRARLIVRLGGGMTAKGNKPQHGDSDSQKDQLVHPT